MGLLRANTSFFTELKEGEPERFVERGQLLDSTDDVVTKHPGSFSNVDLDAGLVPMDSHTARRAKRGSI